MQRLEPLRSQHVYNMLPGLTVAQPDPIIIPHMLSQHDSSMGIHPGNMVVTEQTTSI